MLPLPLAAMVEFLDALPLFFLNPSLSVHERTTLATRSRRTRTPLRLSRRDFVRRGAMGAAALMIGCGTRDDLEQKMISEMGGSSSDMGEMGLPDLADMKEMVDSGASVTPLSKQPFMQFGPQGEARLRFETLTEQGLDVRLERMGALSQEYLATTQTTQIDYTWPQEDIFAQAVPHRDLPGLHTLQQVRFEGLELGARYEWIVHQGDGVETRGSFLAGAPPDRGFRVGWISDTQFPACREVITALAAQSPDLVIHGGDLQYMSSPLDTWNGFFANMHPLLSLAPIHSCIGNHEYEDFDEFDIQYSRLFEGHGDAGSTIEYAALTYGNVRFLLLNSETDFDQRDSAQFQWMLDQFDAIEADGIRHTIVVFHHPVFTFGRHFPRLAARDVLHPIFVERRVTMVMSGHNHCYERFEVDGITYVVDGGGGANTTDPSASLEEVLMQRPGDQDLREAVERSTGSIILEFGADGTIGLERIDESGFIQDSATIG